MLNQKPNQANAQHIRVLFFGTPDFALSSLRALHEADYTLIGVVTQPDKPVGRKQTLTASPVKTYALENTIPVFQPRTLRVSKEEGKNFFEQLNALRPDIAIVVAYGKIIPEEYLSIPRYGFVNVHGSILPALRGPSPIHAAILEGHPVSGVTIMQLDAGMDTGAILATTKVELHHNETTATLHDTLKEKGARLLIETLPLYIAGTIRPQAQDNAIATYCHLITKDDGLLNLANDPILNERKIRAYTPWPGTYVIKDGKRIKILQAHIDAGTLVIDTLQLEGKKPIAYSAYLRGHDPII